jgi:hypothetical protein
MFDVPMTQAPCPFQLGLKFIVSPAFLFAFLLSACESNDVNRRSLSDEISKIGLRISKDYTPLELLELEPRATSEISLDVPQGCKVGFYVQGIGEDLVETHKKSGDYPARLFNVDSPSEFLETSYSASRDFTAKNQKLNLAIQSNHPNPVHVVIYTCSED